MVGSSVIKVFTIFVEVCTTTAKLSEIVSEAVVEVSIAAPL